MVPCLLDHGMAQIIIVVQEPVVDFVVFTVSSVIALGIYGLSQLSASTTITCIVHHTF
jgi:hypothetical protein